MTDLLWYYSGQEQIASAIRAGFLSPLVSSTPAGSPPAIFLSPDPLDGVERLLRRNAVVPARVGIHAELPSLSWKEFARVSGAGALALEQFQKAIRSQLGVNPQRLRVSFQPVPLREWRVAEIRTEEGWAPHPDFPKEDG